MPSKPIGTASTTRLRKAECDQACGNVARQSRAALLRGLLSCPCGGFMVPTALEDVMALDAAGVLPPGVLDVHAEYVAWQTELASIAHGRAGDVHKRGSDRSTRKSADARMTDDELALQRVLRTRRVEARSCQLAALKAHGYGADTTNDEIPF